MSRFPTYRIVLMILALLAFVFFFYETHHPVRRPAPRSTPVRVIPVKPPPQ